MCVCPYTMYNLYLTYGGAFFKAATKVKNNFNSQLWPAKSFIKAAYKEFHQGSIQSFTQIKVEFPRSETQWCCTSFSPLLYLLWL